MNIERRFLISGCFFLVLLVGLAYGLWYIKQLVDTGNIEPFPLLEFTFAESIYVYIFGLGGLLALFLSFSLFLLLSTRRRAERIANRLTEDVLSSRELFMKLYRNSPLPYLLLSYDGIITFPNQAAVRLFGATQQDLEGKDFFKTIRNGDEHVELLLEQYRRGVSLHEEELRMVCPDGSERWILLSIFPLDVSHGRHNGLAAIVDITKQKEVDKAKTEFVSLASHQLRTPISSLKWNAELLASPRLGELNERQQEQITTIRRSVERMNTIVNDFLNVARLELGTLKADLDAVHVGQLIENMLGDLTPLTTQKKLVIQKNIQVEHIRTNPRLLRMILDNLLSNAVKYTPEGGEIRIEAEKKGGEIVIVVSDNGLGIPENEQGKLFSKLFRASNVRDTVQDGTGFGLYIVKLALNVLGGTISFSSKLNQGTTFTIKLPI
jgi:PAS domain S-box-containing protein